jgi:hypothetical protein
MIDTYLLLLLVLVLLLKYHCVPSDLDELSLRGVLEPELDEEDFLEDDDEDDDDFFLEEELELELLS